MYGLYHNQIRNPFDFEFYVEDLQSLNWKALSKSLDVIKVSFGLLPYIEDDYELLSAGVTMGYGFGPILVGRKGLRLSDLSSVKIGSPGRFSTERALLYLYGGKDLLIIDIESDRIIAGILEGDLDMGLLCNRVGFRIEQYPLEHLLDLGKWWEEKYGLPTPISGFVVRRSLSIKERIEELLRRSLNFAYYDFERALAFSMSISQNFNSEMLKDCIVSHINEYTINLGELGSKAIERMISDIKELGLEEKFFRQKKG